MLKIESGERTVDAWTSGLDEDNWVDFEVANHWFTTDNALENWSVLLVFLSIENAFVDVSGVGYPPSFEYPVRYPLDVLRDRALQNAEHETAQAAVEDIHGQNDQRSPASARPPLHPLRAILSSVASVRLRLAIPLEIATR